MQSLDSGSNLEKGANSSSPQKGDQINFFQILRFVSDIGIRTCFRGQYFFGYVHGVKCERSQFLAMSCGMITGQNVARKNAKFKNVEFKYSIFEIEIFEFDVFFFLSIEALTLTLLSSLVD